MGEEPEFWEKAFNEKQEMWGLEPARSAELAAVFFAEHGVKTVLIPGIGYGRNAKPFMERGMTVTGIELSKTAIEMAAKHFGNRLPVYHGSVTDMPFDHRTYDGIFCHALIHLLDTAERKKLIADCLRQLNPGGWMFFSVISKQASSYGQGKLLGKDRFEQFGGVNMFFYDGESIAGEFGAAGLKEAIPVTENYPFHLISCQREG